MRDAAGEPLHGMVGKDDALSVEEDFRKEVRAGVKTEAMAEAEACFFAHVLDNCHLSDAIPVEQGKKAELIFAGAIDQAGEQQAGNAPGEWMGIVKPLSMPIAAASAMIARCLAVKLCPATTSRQKNGAARCLAAMNTGSCAAKSSCENRVSHASG